MRGRHSNHQPSVAIIEPEPSIRCLLTSALLQSRAFNLEKAFDIGQEALLSQAVTELDAVLINIRLPDMSGAECATKLRVRNPKLKILIFSRRPELVLPDYFLTNAADVYLFGSFNAEDPISALNAIFGQTPNLSSPKKASKPPYALTVRENAVMNLLAKGLLYKEVAVALHISLAVVHKLQHTSFRKLGATNRTEAAKIWWDLVANRGTSKPLQEGNASLPRQTTTEFPKPTANNLLADQNSSLRTPKKFLQL